MKYWKIIIKYNSITFDIKIDTNSYSVVYAKSEETYTGYIVKKGSEIHS